MTDVLARICADKRSHVSRMKGLRSLADLESQAGTMPAPRGFRAALARRVAAGGYGLIAEIKKASPSKGLIRADFDPQALAQAYRDGGATCLSVLTDEPYFQGKDVYLQAAWQGVDLPILRKDFMIDPYQVVEARALGADCILLIMAVVDDLLAAELEAAAINYGMDVLIEVHDQLELERAARLKSRLIGINNRNLKTLSVDLKTAEDLATRLPPGTMAVGESGLSTAADLARLARIGIRCFLIGESLMRQADVAEATRRLLANPVPLPVAAQ